MSQIKAIISDADGTLVNTVYLIRHGQYEAAAEYLMAKGIPKHEIPDYSDYVHHLNASVGGSTKDTLELTLTDIFGSSRPEILQSINFDELDNNLAAIQDHIAPLYVNPFYGLTELFTWTGVSQIKMGIFTSGNPHHIVRNFGVSLPVLGYGEIFKMETTPIYERLSSFIDRAKSVYGTPDIAIVTCEDVAKTKPEPEGILKLFDSLGVKPDEVIVLGDHSYDMQAALAAGAVPVGMAHGFGDPADLTKAGAIKILDNLLLVPQIIEDHNSGKSKLFD